MALANTWAVDYTNKRLYISAGTAVDSVLDLYSWLQDQFDELSALDDTVPMSAQTPTEFSLENGWFIEPEAVKYLKGGAIKTVNWTNVVRKLKFASAGYVSAVASDIGKPVVGGTTGHDATLLAYNNTTREWWVRQVTTADTFSNASEAITITGGTGAGTLNAATASGDNLWANLYTLGSIEAGTQVYVEQNGAALTGWWAMGHVDILLLVKEMGTEIDGAAVVVYAREWTDTYDWFPIDLTAGGRNAVPLATSNDLNNQTAEATVAAYAGISITFGTVSKNLNNGNGAVNYDVTVDCGSHTLARVYEYLKYVTRRGATAAINSVQGQLYRYANSAYSPVKVAPFGSFAGGKFFGARGIWIENYDSADAKNFQLIDASGTTQVPPNTVSVKVDSVAIGDRVAVFRLTGAGGTINKAKYTVSGAHASGATTITVSTAIASDEPAVGALRIGDTRYQYSSWSGSTFTLDATAHPAGLSSALAGGESLFVPLIDKEATTTFADNTLIYAADIPVLVRVRKKGILPFEVETTVGSTGLSVSAIRTTDNIVI